MDREQVGRKNLFLGCNKMGNSIRIIIIIEVILLLAIIVFANVLIIVRFRNFHRRVMGKISPCNTKKCTIVREKYKEKKSKGILSTSLYKACSDKIFNQKYFLPLLKNIEKINNVLPGWRFRIYLSPDLKDDILEILMAKDCEIFVMDKVPEGHEGSMWRFLPASEDMPFLSVDADEDIKTTISPEHIRKWILSKNIFFLRRIRHINLFIPMSAGCWGSKDGAIPDISDKICKYCSTWFGNDEAFLAKEVWPIVKKKGRYKTRTLMSEILSFIFLPYSVIKK